jgi:hypothetical protein
MELPASQPYRPSLLVAFLVCFLWVVSLPFGFFERLPLPEEVKVLLGLVIPLTAVVAILYRTVLFREVGPAVRLLKLFGLALAVLICAGALLAAFSVLLFAFGIISPE